jgi:hypothetical protein
MDDFFGGGMQDYSFAPAQSQISAQSNANAQANANRTQDWNQQTRALNAQMYPAQMRAQHWNQLFPYLKNVSSSGGYGPGANTNVTYGPSAYGVNPSPVYSQGIVQQQVNAQTAANNQKTAGQQQEMQRNLAGKGFGSSSPLQAALSTMMGEQNLATNTANEQQTRFGAAQANAQNILGGQQINQQANAAYNNALNQRQEMQYSNQNALLSALASMA